MGLTVGEGEKHRVIEETSCLNDGSASARVSRIGYTADHGRTSPIGSRPHDMNRVADHAGWSDKRHGLSARFNLRQEEAQLPAARGPTKRCRRAFLWGERKNGILTRGKVFQFKTAWEA